jgi:hypothetical protein
MFSLHRWLWSASVEGCGKGERTELRESGECDRGSRERAHEKRNEMHFGRDGAGGDPKALEDRDREEAGRKRVHVSNRRSV